MVPSELKLETISNAHTAFFLDLIMTYEPLHIEQRRLRARDMGLTKVDVKYYGIKYILALSSICNQTRDSLVGIN